MKVRLTVSRSGADGAFAPGDEIEVSENEGVRMIEAGQAEAVRTTVKETTSARRKVEKAAK